MDKIISSPYRGYCPGQQCNRDVDVHYKIDVTFPHKQFGRFAKASCPDEDNCRYLKGHSDCPLLHEVKEHYNPNACGNMR